MSIQELSDDAILREIGDRIKQRRITLNYTQEETSVKAGLSKLTISKCENGTTPVTLNTLIRILRVLNSLDAIDDFLPKQQFSPIEIAKLLKNRKQRASSKRNNK